MSEAIPILAVATPADDWTLLRDGISAHFPLNEGEYKYFRYYVDGNCANFTINGRFVLSSQFVNNALKGMMTTP